MIKCLNIDFRIRKTQVKFLVLLFTCCLSLTKLHKLFDSVSSSIKLEIKNNHLTRFLREFRQKNVCGHTKQSLHTFFEIYYSDINLVSSDCLCLLFILYILFNCYKIIISQNRRKVLAGLQRQEAEMQWCQLCSQKAPGSLEGFYSQPKPGAC